MQSRRGELRRQLAVRRDARGVPEGLLDELVDEAVCSVAMMCRAVTCEEHTLGAFWTTIGFLLRRYREGRYALRIGASRPVALDDVLTQPACSQPGPAELAELGDEAARAADRLAVLSELERRVLAAMTVDGAGTARVAGLLKLGVGEIRSAARSAQLKLDQVETVAAAGRMCGYRRPAILACVEGRANVRQRRVARAHLHACAACRRAYAAELRRAGWGLLPGLPGLLPGGRWVARLRERFARDLSRVANHLLTRPRTGLVRMGTGGGILPSYLAVTLATATVTLTSSSPSGHRDHREEPAAVRVVSTTDAVTRAATSHVAVVRRVRPRRRIKRLHTSGRGAHVLAPTTTAVSRTVASAPVPTGRRRATPNAEFGFEQAGKR